MYAVGAVSIRHWTFKLWNRQWMWIRSLKSEQRL